MQRTYPFHILMVALFSLVALLIGGAIGAIAYAGTICNGSRRYTGGTESDQINHKTVFINLSPQCHPPDLWLQE